MVDQFASREPDHRLVALLDEYPRPDSVRTLDLGCAGGRNTVLLAERGLEVWAADASFDLVVSLGVYYNAGGLAEWERALPERARVLKLGGRLLVNHFTPEVDLTGEGVRPVPVEPGVYEGSPGGRAVLLAADALDGTMARYGLDPELPSATVRVETGKGRRVSVNALYRRR